MSGFRRFVARAARILITCLFSACCPMGCPTAVMGFPSAVALAKPCSATKSVVVYAKPYVCG